MDQIARVHQISRVLGAARGSSPAAGRRADSRWARSIATLAKQVSRNERPAFLRYGRVIGRPRHMKRDARPEKPALPVPGIVT